MQSAAPVLPTWRRLRRRSPRTLKTSAYVSINQHPSASVSNLEEEKEEVPVH
jgi:hypothetical protein